MIIVLLSAPARGWFLTRYSSPTCSVPFTCSRCSAHTRQHAMMTYVLLKQSVLCERWFEDCFSLPEALDSQTTRMDHQRLQCAKLIFQASWVKHWMIMSIVLICVQRLRCAASSIWKLRKSCRTPMSIEEDLLKISIAGNLKASLDSVQTVSVDTRAVRHAQTHPDRSHAD